MTRCSEVITTRITKVFRFVYMYVYVLTYIYMYVYTQTQAEGKQLYINIYTAVFSCVVSKTPVLDKSAKECLI